MHNHTLIKLAAVGTAVLGVVGFLLGCLLKILHAPTALIWLWYSPVICFVSLILIGVYYFTKPNRKQP
jgi:hypothetical protein